MSYRNATTKIILHRARIRNGAAVDAEFVLFWLWYAFEIASVYFGRGNVTTIPNLSQSKLCELPLPLPPVQEQRKIAALLGLVQRAIEQPVLRCHKVAYQSAAVLAQAVPDDEHITVHVLQQMHQEDHHLGLRMAPGNRRK